MKKSQFKFVSQITLGKETLTSNQESDDSEDDHPLVTLLSNSKKPASPKKADSTEKAFYSRYVLQRDTELTRKTQQNEESSEKSLSKENKNVVVEVDGRKKETGVINPSVGHRTQTTKKRKHKIFVLNEKAATPEEHHSAVSEKEETKHKRQGRADHEDPEPKHAKPSTTEPEHQLQINNDDHEDLGVLNFWEDGMVDLPDMGHISEVVSSCLLKSKFWNILSSYFACLSVK